ncbi:MAG: hypothetical protein L0J17_02595 [Brevibacterium sp.]|uniref:hypothetical protein n=1 Tax=Brevibacterium sp. TaxID=1701 RepID=UPI0026471D48|nr:hypothetical protein [Brevibacterium sp.]MDN5806271.1 hypothetical protein [Brevibacterium sp.]MDN5834600.1 hypothetical protein [Brevibacterium sp.]MDN5876081.1 hypothetical protein [Brevibacterium sp.]MDN5908899.1 hypothetical protein [Brevibacterium sp.]MDN6132772.1 hypothetical protein [Brevibacterium sp.]
MRRFFAVAAILSRGRTGRMYLWPILASLCVYVIALSILVPLFGLAERSGSNEGALPSAPTPATTTQEQPHGVPPNFSIAVGTDDEAQEMPAIQSAMTDYLSFSDEFFTRLKQGAVAPDFSTSERELSPESARAQVEDGTSVLAVLLPKDLTPQVMGDIRGYYRGDIDAPSYTITVLASPQALNEDTFILDQYQDQVIRQAEEHVSEQIRIVAHKFGCEDGAQQNCPRSQQDAERAFERSFDVRVDDVSGPPPVDYFSNGTQSQGPRPTTQSPAAAPQATPPSTPPAPQLSLNAKISALLSALVLGAVTLAMLSSGAVNRAAGLQLVIIGPWRSLSPQRPFPRRTVLSQKFGLAAAGALPLTMTAGISSIWPGRNILDSLGAYPSLRVLALIGFLCLICLTAAIVILAVSDALGALVGAAVAAGTIAWGTVWSPLASLLGPSRSGLWGNIQLLIGGNRQIIVELVPTVVVLLAILVSALLGSLAATAAYDRRFSTQINQS